MLEKTIDTLFGTKQEQDLKQLIPILQTVNEKEPWALSLADDDFPAETEKLRSRLSAGESLDDLLPDAFALAREAARRVLGERPYDVQILGGVVLHQGRIMEMKTGEGKTLSSITAAYLNSLSGQGVHVITVNDYLAGRDAEWMGPVYRFLGVDVGFITAEMDNEQRREGYSRDITYGTNNEFGFDYLRDNMRWSIDERVQKYHHFCIIDEIDSILIDEARTPLIISGPAEDDTAKFAEMNRLAPQLIECEVDPETGEYPEDPEGDYKLEEKSKRVTFTDQGMNHIEELLQRNKVISGSLFDEENFEYLHYFTQAIRAHRLYQKDVDYVVQENQVQIVDEFTGRILQGRRYSDGLHQAIEAKENIKIAQRNRTLATITFQNYFRMYDKISGMTGTAETEAKEFGSIYGLDVAVIPTNRPVIRIDSDDVIFLTETDKMNAIVEEIRDAQQRGQPVLVGTVSIEKSELLAKALTRGGVRHEVLNAKNHAREAMIIAEAGAAGSVTIATNMAGRGTDIKLGGNPEYRARKLAGTDADEETYRKVLAKSMAEWRSQYEAVKESGGLYVIGTERHESRRIDNQLRGRSGRQGDPGFSRFFLSMDDTLMRLFGGENMKGIMSKVGMKDGEPLYHPWINKAIERAQNRVEERNFEIRKHLLEFDDVVNEQRKFIYQKRDDILSDEDLSSRIMATAEDIVDDLLDQFHQEKQESGSVSAAGRFLDSLKEAFLFEPGFSPEDFSELSDQHIRSRILDDLSNDLEAKKEQVGEKEFNFFIRIEYIRSIDSKWQDHLENLESLREAVYLRSYGQKNPLLEYKLEGFEIFDTMIYDIRTALAKKVFKVQFRKKERRSVVLEKQPVGNASHRDLGQFAVGSSGKSASTAAAPPKESTQPGTSQVKRTYPKVGRNDPCPCGSGKKYKHCHGR
ncbi:MAG: preprotein translocase subunit SecA [Spirochaetales bacterium]|nr:preprotein translocase subunit SecA [Spirochaetales bacterium]MCF7939136.1 preprotein translocase subunit SecA [Spirochaetales bacterium]